MCHFSVTNREQPLALDDFENMNPGVDGVHAISLGRNFISASLAVIVESISLMFVAFTDEDGNSFLIGVRTIIIKVEIYKLFYMN